MGVLGVRLDSENQVFRFGHVGFPILGNVASRVVKSDFPHDQMRMLYPGQLNYPRLCQTRLDCSEFQLDFTKIYRQISPASWTKLFPTNKHNTVQNVRQSFPQQYH